MSYGGRLCVAVYVFGTYSRYIPYYVYSILKSYPEYHVKIFVDKELSSSEKKCMELIKKGLSSNFSISENYFREYGFLDETHIGGGGKKILRWLLPEWEFEGFDYIYVGDVDFLIVKEEPSLLDSHIQHCEQTQLPFSNKIRLAPDSTNRTNRLTGLHFIIKEPYYKVIGSHIASYLENKDILLNALSGISNNEQFLYNLVEQNFDLNKLLNHDDFRPHHGIHLGLARDRGVMPSKILKRLTDSATAESVRLEDTREFLCSCVNDNLFQELLCVLPEESIFNICSALKIKMPGRRLKLKSSVNVMRQMVWRPIVVIHSMIYKSTK